MQTIAGNPFTSSERGFLISFKSPYTRRIINEFVNVSGLKWAEIAPKFKILACTCSFTLYDRCIFHLSCPNQRYTSILSIFPSLLCPQNVALPSSELLPAASACATLPLADPGGVFSPWSSARPTEPATNKIVATIVADTRYKGVGRPHVDWNCRTPQWRTSLVVKSSQNYSRRAHRRPIGYNRTPQIHLQNCPFPTTISTPLNTPIPRPTPLTAPNGIQIQSAVLPQYIFWTATDRPTVGIGDKPVPRALMFTPYGFWATH